MQDIILLTIQCQTIRVTYVFPYDPKKKIENGINYTPHINYVYLTPTNYKEQIFILLKITS